MKNILLLCLLGAILISAINCDDTAGNPTQQQANSEQVDTQQDSTEYTDAQQDNKSDSSAQENTTEQIAAPQAQANQEQIDYLSERKRDLEAKYSQLQAELTILYNKFVSPSTSNEARQQLKLELYRTYLRSNKIEEDIEYVTRELNSYLQ